MRLATEILEEHNGLFPDYIIAAMKEYAKEACEEQKKICLANAKADWDRHVRGNIEAFVKDYTILNAPLPELK